jgi:hypothetical protein
MGGYESDSDYWKRKGEFNAFGDLPLPAGKKNDVYVINGYCVLGPLLHSYVGLDARDLDILYCVRDNAGGTIEDVRGAWIIIPHREEVVQP